MTALKGTALDDLPDEVLQQVFAALVNVGPCWDTQDDPWFIKRLPFRTADVDHQPHPGMRAYPFLGQVCKKWKTLLEMEMAKKQIWKQLVVDFGHELVTAIHMPLKWSNQRPSTDEFAMAFQGTTLSAGKILEFVDTRATCIESLVLCNSEGFWGDEGEYLSLQNKHNFQSSHLGFMIGALRNNLREIQLWYCNDLLSSDHGLWSMASQCPSLRTLSVEGVNCRLASSSLADLARLKNLSSLSIVSEEQSGQWIVGLDAMPPEWSRLTALSSLELRGHQLLDTLPAWLKGMGQLRKLDVSCCGAVDIALLPELTQLEVLGLQRMEMSQPAAPGETVSQAAKKFMPDLSALKRLRALSLGGNRMTRLPDCLSKLTALEVLDASGNRELKVLTPLTGLLAALPRIEVLDFRCIHEEKDAPYWSDAKCTTMKHLAAASKLLKRRKYPFRVLIEVNE